MATQGMQTWQASDSGWVLKSPHNSTRGACDDAALLFSMGLAALPVDGGPLLLGRTWRRKLSWMRCAACSTCTNGTHAYALNIWICSGQTL